MSARSITLSAITLVLLAGCAPSRTAALKPGASSKSLAEPSAQAVADAFPRVRALAASQSKANTRPTAPMVGPNALGSVADAVQTLAAGAVSSPAALGTAEPEAPERQLRALQLYATGRQKLLSADAAGALVDLQEAVQLDPQAIEPRRELADAAIAAGNRSLAIESIAAAVARGDTSARSFEFLARDAAEKQDGDRAAAWYARAFLALGLVPSAGPAEPAGAADPILVQIVRVGLADQLRGKGYTAAAITLTRDALTSQTPFSSSTRYARQAGEVFRRQGDLWRQVGDDHAALGQYEAAIEAYARARAFPSLDGQPITPRLVSAAVAAGQTARAALVVLEDSSDAASGGGDDTPPRLSDQDIALLTTLTASGSEGGVLRGAIAADLAERLNPSRPLAPSAASSLARIQVALSVDAQAAAGHLASAVGRNPSDVALARQFVVQAQRAGSVDTLVSSALAIVAAEPRSAAVVAQALLLDGPEFAVLQPAIDANRSDAATLLAAYALAIRGDVTDAAARLGDSSADAHAIARVDFAAAQGLPVAVPEPTTPDRRRAAVRALTLQQRHRAALEALEPLLDPTGGSSATSPWVRHADLLQAAEIAAALGDVPRATGHLNEAQRLDPADDRALAMRLNLHSPAGPSPSQPALTAALRQLRTTLADTRTARLLRAREALRRSLNQQALRESQGLAEADPTDAAALETLIAAASRQRGVFDAPGWIEARLARLPRQPSLLAAWASVAAAQATDRAAAAAQIEARLLAALDRSSSVDLARVVESFCRDELKDAAKAEALAEKRRQRDPASIATLLERAIIESTAATPGGAAAALAEALTPDITLINDQPQRVVSIASNLLQRAGQSMRDTQPDRPAVLEPSSRAALRLLDRAETLRVRLTPDLAAARLYFLGVDSSTSVERLLAASTATAEAYPEVRPTADLRVAGGLVAAQRHQDAQSFFKAALDPSRTSVSGASERVELAAAWFRMVATSARVADARIMLDTLHGLPGGLLQQLVARFSAPQAEPPESARAEAAFILGNIYHADGHEAESEAAYLLALEYQPDHAWTANNLGYAWADRGANVERAAELLEMAHAKKPQEAAITDSLGWLRYKQGRLRDFTDDTGRQRQGAVSLLLEAAATAHGLGDMTIQDHAGDALWLDGQRQRAIEHWSRALNIARRTLAEAAQRAGLANAEASAATLDEARRIASSASGKLAQAKTDAPVGVAPQYANPDPRPAIDNPDPNRPGADGADSDRSGPARPRFVPRLPIPR